MEDIRKMLNDNAVLPLWPETGKTILGMSRSGTYAAAERGDIKTIRFGRLMKVSTAWLRQKLDLERESGHRG
jgi:hypothetical protein